MKITIEKDWVKITTEFSNSDVNLDQLFEAFKGMLVALTYSEQSINNFIIELVEDLTED
jgi:hypothetical protein